MKWSKYFLFIPCIIFSVVQVFAQPFSYEIKKKKKKDSLNPPPTGAIYLSAVHLSENGPTSAVIFPGILLSTADLVVPPCPMLRCI
jgi:hypothetical protein